MEAHRGLRVHVLALDFLVLLTHSEQLLDADADVVQGGGQHLRPLLVHSDASCPKLTRIKSAFSHVASERCYHAVCLLLFSCCIKLEARFAECII